MSEVWGKAQEIGDEFQGWCSRVSGQQDKLCVMAQKWANRISCDYEKTLFHHRWDRLSVNYIEQFYKDLTSELTSSLKGLEIGTHSETQMVCQLFLEMNQLFKQRKTDFLKELILILFLSIWLVMMSNTITFSNFCFQIFLTCLSFLIPFCSRTQVSDYKQTVRITQFYPMQNVSRDCLGSANRCYFKLSGGWAH